MNTQSRYTQQITVLELILETLNEQLNAAIDKTNTIENLIYLIKIAAAKHI